MCINLAIGLSGRRLSLEVRGFVETDKIRGTEWVISACTGEAVANTFCSVDQLVDLRKNLLKVVPREEGGDLTHAVDLLSNTILPSKWKRALWRKSTRNKALQPMLAEVCKRIEDVHNLASLSETTGSKKVVYIIEKFFMASRMSTSSRFADRNLVAFATNPTIKYNSHMHTSEQVITDDMLTGIAYHMSTEVYSNA